MSKSMFPIIFALIGLLMVVACDSSSSRPATSEHELQTATPQQISLTDQALMTLVKRFAAGVENEPDVFRELERYPRAEVIDHLQRLQDALPVSSRDRIATAFLLCNLDHGVADNKRVISEAFLKEPHAKNLDADWELELISRLIRKGHKDLLPALFLSSQWADGAMAESLSGFLSDQVRTGPQVFVSDLSREPKDVRKSVYALLSYSEFTKTEVAQFRSYVRSVTDPTVKSVAMETLSAISKAENR